MHISYYLYAYKFIFNIFLWHEMGKFFCCQNRTHNLYIEKTEKSKTNILLEK